jgi:hypothetical protein
MISPELPDFDGHITSGHYRAFVIKLRHSDRSTGDVIHKWEAPAFSEYGGLFLNNDDDWFCPECGEGGRQEP